MTVACGLRKLYFVRKKTTTTSGIDHVIALERFVKKLGHGTLLIFQIFLSLCVTPWLPARWAPL